STTQVAWGPFSFAASVLLFSLLRRPERLIEAVQIPRNPFAKRLCFFIREIERKALCTGSRYNGNGLVTWRPGFPDRWAGARLLFRRVTLQAAGQERKPFVAVCV